MSRSLLFCLALAALPSCGSAPAPASRTKPAVVVRASVPTTPAPAPVDPEVTPLPLWNEVRRGQLANGLTYYVLPHKKPEQRALLWLAVDAGSILEDDDQKGLAHFCEHMAFNGTTHFPKQAIVQYLESIGMRFGADLNAYTNFDQTVYQLEIPTDRADTLTRGLDILRDWAGGVSFDPKEVESERGVVREEWRLGRGAQQRIFDKQARTLFDGSRYADRLVIGELSVLEQAPAATLRRFYQDWYRPNLMAIIVVGEVDPAKVEQEIRQRFGDLKNPTPERPRIAGGLPRADGTRVSVVTDREATSTTISIVNPVATRKKASRHDYRRLLIEQLYQALLNQRFAAVGRRADAPFLMASGGVQSLTRSFDAFSLAAQAKRGHVEQALRGLLTEIVRVERHGFLPAELDRAKIELLRTFQHEAATEATQDSRHFAAEILRYAFEGELLVGRTAEQAIAQEILPTIQLAELAQVAAQFASAQNRVVLLSGPEGSPLPKPSEVLALVEDVAKHDLPVWIDKPAPGGLMATPPAPGKIIAEKQLAAVGVTEWTLSNGVRVVVKPSDFVQDQVILLGSSPGGHAMVKDADARAAMVATNLVDLGGVADFDFETLQKVLTGKRVKVGLGIEATTESVSASGSSVDLETLLQLVHLKLSAPRLDLPAIAIAKAKFAELLRNMENNPQYQFGKHLIEALWRNDPRHRLPSPAEIEQLDPQRAFAIYKDRFGNAGDFVFVIVGAVDLGTLRPLVETYLGGLPATKRKEIEKDLKVRKTPGVVKRSWRLGQAPKAMVSIEFHGDELWTRDKDRDEYNLSAVLAIRLREVLREDKGGVYGVQVSGDLVRSPHGERSFSISFGCDPTRVDELVAATMSEIASIQKDGVAPEYLEKVKQAWLRLREKQLRENPFWARWLLTSYRYGDDPAIVLDPHKMVERATSDNVKAAARRYLDARQYFLAVLLPEK